MLLFLMMLTPEQKEHAIELIQMGDKLEAVRYLQEVLAINAENALLLTEKLEQEVDAEDEQVINDLKAQHLEAQKNPVDVGRLVGGIFMVVGCIMLAIAAWIGVSNYKFAQRAIPIKGIVLNYSSYESKSDDGRYTTMYTPTYQYQFEGKTYTYTSSTSSSSQEYDVNEAVDVLVDPQEPSEVLIDSFWERWFVVILLGGMGTLFAGMGYLVYRVLGNADSSK
jgi:Protein of unknown function (DUF3592)